MEINNKEYYKVNTSFKDINDIKENFNIEDVIFVLYKNKIHYDYLKINKTFILQQIISSFNNNQQLILEKNELNSTSDKKENYNLSSTKKLIKNEKNTENKNNFNELKKIININNLKESSNLKRKDINKDFKEPKKEKEEDIIKFEQEVYDNIIKKFEEEKIQIYNHQNKITKEIPQFPILIGTEIKKSYYSDIYKYLYCKKYNIKNYKIFTSYIYEIKEKKRK